MPDVRCSWRSRVCQKHCCAKCDGCWPSLGDEQTRVAEVDTHREFLAARDAPSPLRRQVLCSSEEQERYGFQQSVHCDRLVDERLVFPQHAVLREQSVAKAREVEDFRVRVAVTKMSRQFVARHL